MAFIGFKFDPLLVLDIRQQCEFPGERKEIGRSHITTLFLGHDLPVDTIKKAADAAEHVAKRSRPLMVKVNRVHGFEPSGTSHEKVPIVASVECDELHRIHQLMKAAYDKAGVEYNKEFVDYRPHITLATSTQKQDAQFGFTLPHQKEQLLKEIVLWDDNAVFAKIPLHDSEERILFLDVDGVLNRDGDYHRIVPECVQELLRILHMTEAKVVISSTWRISGLDKESIFQEKLLEAAGEANHNYIMSRIVGATPAKMSNYHRGNEIKWWLEQNEFRGRFAILDDEMDVRPYNDLLVKTNCKTGLTTEDVAKVVYLLTA